MNESNIEVKLIEQQNQDMSFKMKTGQSISSTASQGLENSVISVIPVNEPQLRNNLKSTGVVKTDLQVVDHTNNIFRK